MAWNTLSRHVKKHAARISPTRIHENYKNLEGKQRQSVRGYAAMGLIAAAIGGVVGTGALADGGESVPAEAKAVSSQTQRLAEGNRDATPGPARPAGDKNVKDGDKSEVGKATLAAERKPAEQKAESAKPAPKKAEQHKPAAKPQPPKPAPAPPKPAPKPPQPQPADAVEGWIWNAISIMQSKGVPVSKADTGAIRTVIEKESSADPNAINLWDSNAVKGTPSKGLMQTIDPTFNSYKLPGYDNIYDPVDNIIAGVRYTLARYGSFAEHPGLASMAGGGGYRGY
ncbi:transglycosylase SLT domain-containing protein [Prauserella cavernicola]|uniref:transglycosylase SLT domain-containing protein n=1 Tax=Prauserella cavernicola TaxID=2800127 RepID=UPI0027DB50F2|nr:transglycosylase SLT domain-containing protein [Prauserella cavernicola]